MNASTTEKPSIVLIVTGLLIIAGSFWGLISTWRFMANGVSTYGEIIEITGAPVVGAGQIFPVFEYQTEAGIRFQDRGVGSGHPLYNVEKLYPVGTRVPVIYDPNNLGNAKIDTVFQAWLFPVFFSLVGLGVGFNIARAGL